MEKLPARKPNRLTGYDYSKNGAYFITICAKSHAELFGKIVQNVGAAFCRPPFLIGNKPQSPEISHMQLSETGMIVQNEIRKISETYPGVLVDQYVIMPNHIHMIIIITDNVVQCSTKNKNSKRQRLTTVENSWRQRLTMIKGNECLSLRTIENSEQHRLIKNKNIGRQNAAPTVSRIMNQWKRSISMQAGFSPWQKSFHDHIIRNQEEYDRIVEYIENNPIRWEEDQFNILQNHITPTEQECRNENI